MDDEILDAVAREVQTARRRDELVDRLQSVGLKRQGRILSVLERLLDDEAALQAVEAALEGREQ